MCKTIKNFDNKLTFENLLSAHKRGSKNKTNKREVLKFNIDLETNIVNIINELKCGIYKSGKYKEFRVFEPKERLIKALPYKDRVVQQWYVEEFIKPYYKSRFIKDTYACIEDRGTHKAIEKTQKYMRIMRNKYNNYYILKCDIKKYFYSIDKNILKDILRKSISNKKLLNLTYTILDDENIIGIPIGNYTSQWFANIYLNELDHFAKEKLKIKYYIRYMDDFVCLLKSKEECKKTFEEIRFFLLGKLHLDLNDKSRYYPNSMGINFCGFRIYEDYKLLRVRFKYQINKKIKIWNYLYKDNILNSKKMILSWNSLLGHAKHCDSYRFISKCKKYKLY